MNYVLAAHALGIAIIAGTAAWAQILISFCYFILGYIVTIRFPIFELIFHGWSLSNLYFAPNPPPRTSQGPIHHQAPFRWEKICAAFAYLASSALSYKYHGFAFIYGAIVTVVSVAHIQGIIVPLAQLVLRALRQTEIFSLLEYGCINIYYIVTRTITDGCAVYGLIHSRFRGYMLRNLFPGNALNHIFQYPPIRHTTGHIRLLKLEGGYSGIRCNMIHVPLDNPPAYDAISYTWGDPTKFKNLSISGAQFSVTKNVYGILCDLAPLVGNRCIWIDSICINQTDIDEKNQQVQLMRRIYQGASKTIVWLGDAPDAALVRDFVPLLGRYFHRRIALGEPTQNSLPFNDQAESWIALQRLLNHAYWSRVWIIQEVSVARIVEILYGGKPIEWELFSLVVSTFMATDNGAFVLLMDTFPGNERLPMDGISFVAKLFHLRRKIKERPLPLTELLLECAQSVATQPVDKVFALHGISDAAATGALKLDYSQTFQEVYIKAVFHTLRCGSFSLLTMGGVCTTKTAEAQNLPSWVPDLSNPSKLYPLENAHSNYQAGTNCKVGFEPMAGSKALAIQGVLFDKIKRVAQIPPASTLPENQYSAQNFSFDKITLQINAHDLTRHREVHRIAQSYTQERYHTNQPRHEALWRTLIGDETPTSRPAEPTVGEDYAAYLRMQGILHRGMEHAGLDDGQFVFENKERLYRINHLMGRTINARQFAVTKKGYMALVPLGTQEGDWVAVFSGAATPHVLRAVTEGGDEFQVVGDAYVHGLMDGEAFRAKVRRETIVLV
jgi:hypothetical protein